MLSIIQSIVNTYSGILYCHAECHLAKCCYHMHHSVLLKFAMLTSYSVVILTAEFSYCHSECHSVECCYSEHHIECCYTEGPIFVL
jgi:hypothetical protein